MNKNDLVSSVASACGITKAEAERTIEATFDSITSSLQSGEEVRLIGFGTFVVAQRPATEGRNPRTGQKIQIPTTKVPKFRPGKQLKEAVSV